MAETLRAARIECDIIHVRKRASFETAREHDRFDVILADLTCRTRTPKVP